MKMWFFPVLTILAAVGIVAVLVQMFFSDDTRSQLLLSLLSWACRAGAVRRDPLAGWLDARRGGRVRSRPDSGRRRKHPRPREPDPRRRAAARRARGHRGQRPCGVPRGGPGQPRRHRTGGPRGGGVRVGGDHRAAQERLDRMLEDLRGRGLTARASSATTDRWSRSTQAAGEFEPDHVVISTQPRGPLDVAAPRGRGRGAQAPRRPRPARRGARTRSKRVPRPRLAPTGHRARPGRARCAGGPARPGTAAPRSRRRGDGQRVTAASRRMVGHRGPGSGPVCADPRRHGSAATS